MFAKPLTSLKFPPAAKQPAPAKQAAAPPSFTSAANPETVAEAVNAARRSQRVSLLGGLNPEHFIAARDTRDASTALALSYWLSEETGIKVRGSDPKLFLEDLHSGAVLCALGNKINPKTPFRFNPKPSNEFQRMENFELFTRSLKPLKLSSQPPSAMKNELAAYLPCLLELAMRARGNSEGEAAPQDVSKYFCVLCRASTSFDTTKGLMDHLEANHANLNIAERQAGSHGPF